MKVPRRVSVIWRELEELQNGWQPEHDQLIDLWHSGVVIVVARVESWALQELSGRRRRIRHRAELLPALDYLWLIGHGGSIPRVQSRIKIYDFMVAWQAFDSDVRGQLRGLGAQHGIAAADSRESNAPAGALLYE
jgi:hypothetical protein